MAHEQGAESIEAMETFLQVFPPGKAIRLRRYEVRMSVQAVVGQKNRFWLSLHETEGGISAHLARQFDPGSSRAWR